jgi:hypothetical protein
MGLAGPGGAGWGWAGMGAAGGVTGGRMGLGWGRAKEDGFT